MAIKLKVNSQTNSVRLVAAGEKKPLITPDSVALGADTTGNYIANITAGDGIVVTANQIETANVEVSHADTSSQANTNNTALGLLNNITVDQFGHLTTVTNTELNTSNFSFANGVISSQSISFANTVLNLGGNTSTLDGLSFTNVGSISGPNNDISFSNNRLINVAPPEANTDVVTREYLSDELVALELTVRVVEDPVDPRDAANKRYVDNTAQGLIVRPTALAATTTDLGGTFESGNTSIGATITIPAAPILNIDGVINWSRGDNVLVKNQNNPEENGSYNIDVVGSSLIDWVLRRAFFNVKASDVPGSYEFVTDGNTYGQTGWVATVADAETFQLDVNDITWTQFQGVGTFTAGNGLSLEGTEFHVDASQVINSITPNTGILQIGGTGAVALPTGNTSDRPSPAQGMIRFNSLDGQFEGYDGIAWSGLGGVIDVDQDTKIEAENTAGSDNDQLKFFTGGTQTLLLDSTQMLANVNVVIDTTGAITIPNGNTTERPTPVQGMIRFNNQDGQFEGYDGVAWSGLGGVIDVDQDTKITAESSPGSDNDELRFITGGSLAAKIDSSNTTYFYGNVDVTGNVTIGGNITIGDANTDAIQVVADFESNLIPDADRSYNLGSPVKNWNKLFVDTIDSNDEVITIDTTGAVKIPVGTVAERPSAVTGMLRYNTDDSRFEGYDGLGWAGLAGSVIDIDQDTKITAESSPNADNDELEFFTAGVKQLTIGTNIVANSTITSAGDLNLDAAGNISVNNNRITDVATPTAATDAANKAYVDTFTSNLSIISGENGANTYNYINLIQSPTITFTEDHLEVKGVPDQANNSFELGLTEPMAGSEGIYGNDGFSPRIRITADGRIDFATEIPVELQANAIPDFTETVHDLVGLMFTDGQDAGLNKGINFFNIDANNTIYAEITNFDINLGGDVSGANTVVQGGDVTIPVTITANYVNDIESTANNSGISITHTQSAGSVPDINLDYTYLDTRYSTTTGATFTGNVFAPRYYDSDDNAYYMDPNGTSIIKGLKVGEGQSYSQIEMKDGASSSAYIYATSGKIGFLDQTFNFAAYADKQSGDWVVQNGDVKAERFVDADATTYFLHPGGTNSFLKHIQVETVVQASDVKIGGSGADRRIYVDNGQDLQLQANGVSISTGTALELNVNSSRITNVAAPTAGTDAANKTYVDNTVQGLRVIPSALAATTVDLGAIYNNGAGTLTANTNVAFSLDDVISWNIGDKVLVKDQTNAEENGSYEVTVIGSGATPWVLTRGEYFNESSEIPGSFQFVTDGTTNGGTGYVATVNDAETFSLGTDAVNWYQFSGEGTYTGGDGLTLTGTTFSVNVDNSTLEINNDTLEAKPFTIVDENGANTEINLGTSLTFTGTDGVDTTVTAGQVAIAINEIDGGTF